MPKPFEVQTRDPLGIEWVTVGARESKAEAIAKYEHMVGYYRAKRPILERPSVRLVRDNRIIKGPE